MQVTITYSSPSRTVEKHQFAATDPNNQLQYRIDEVTEASGAKGGAFVVEELVGEDGLDVKGTLLFHQCETFEEYVAWLSGNIDRIDVDGYPFWAANLPNDDDPDFLNPTVFEFDINRRVRNRCAKKDAEIEDRIDEQLFLDAAHGHLWYIYGSKAAASDVLKYAVRIDLFDTVVETDAATGDVMFTGGADASYFLDLYNDILTHNDSFDTSQRIVIGPYFTPDVATTVNEYLKYHPEESGLKSE